MAFSTGVTLLTTIGIPSTFTLSLGTPSGEEVSSSGSISRDLSTLVVIDNQVQDGGFGSLSNITYSLTNTIGNGIGTYSQSFLNSATSANNTLRLTLTSGSFAWRETDVIVTATSSTGATRLAGRSVIRTACNYSGPTVSYSKSALSGDSETKNISYTDPFDEQTPPKNILVNGVTISTYNESSADFEVEYSSGTNFGTAFVTLKADRLGTFSTTLNHSAIDSWGFVGAAGSSYSVSATRNLQWYATNSYSKNSNGIKILFSPSGHVHYGYGGTDPHYFTNDVVSSWIGNSKVFDILAGTFIRTPALYQIKIAHVSGDTSWTFSRVNTATLQNTPLNKDQWYDMAYNSAYPSFCVNLTSNDVSGVYSCVVNIQIRNMANTASYSQNVTLTLTDS